MKSHFTFTKEQRKGILFLLLIIVLCQCAYFFIDFASNDIVINKEELARFQEEIDSLKKIEIEARKPKVFPFNPNYITDYKGANLGMSTEEIDRLITFRNHGNWINSAEQFQQVTKVSDSLLNIIAPYFKFPDWVLNPVRASSWNGEINENRPRTFAQKQDLNKVTALQLQKISGIGAILSERIIKYRNKFIGGFIADEQLQDVYGLTPEVIEQLTNEFTVKTPRQIKKINLNKATVDELVTIQHIDYEIAHNIVEQRVLREGFESINDLTKVKDFPSNKLEIIKLYLLLE
ncbi:helix-hairpin-helix domain-containing protein [Seonamhaeicola sediminis]|uniref:Helix-hairpin-helix domain-containing protein n=1 Tax=Seonamhaeicola sediminis TaxID=2528206 RepID=A0A562YGZ9_9FLAO|nr:helix-hairpin-helix domain-containing protein [Seonamhaeicola sediminis]TWO34293.1 helix-hairpin-helix domain-containing protein [Seonamhaeicola sediminis]